MTNNVHVIPGRSCLLDPLSPSRAKLASLINTKLSILDHQRQMTAARARLREAQEAEHAASAKLAELNMSEGARMAEWARSSAEGDAPTFDVDFREQLLGVVRTAAAHANAARQAETSINADIQREAVMLKAAELQITLASADVLLETLDPLLDDFSIANNALSEKASRILMAIQHLTQVAHASGTVEEMKPLFEVLARANEKMRTFSTRIEPGHETKSKSLVGWASLAERLRSDPIAQLEEVR
jgi:hypothetical protein